MSIISFNLPEDAEAVAGNDLEDIVLCVPVSSSEKHRIELRYGKTHCFPMLCL